MILLSKNPIAARFSLALLVGTPLAAQAPLTEADAVSRALGRPEWQALTRLPSEQATGAALEARAWLSPSLEWSRESFTGIQPGKREDTYLLTQGVDVSGRWWARREGALRREEAGRADTQVRTAGVVAQTRDAFFEVLVAQERVTRLDRALARLQKAQTRVDRLHEAGEMSGLERGRVRREVEILLGRQAQERAALVRARVRLVALLDQPLEGVEATLLPPAPEPLDAVETRLKGSATTALTQAQEAAAQADAKAAGRWFPELIIGVGVKRWQENGLSGNGSVFSLGLALPTPGRVQGARRRAEAEARAAAAQAKLQRAQDTAEVRALWQEVTDLRASALRLGQETQEPAKVEAALDAAFEAGELDLLARLDGARTLLDAELAALDQAHRARRAGIALDRLLGKVNP